jgi:hypothetical protein
MRLTTLPIHLNRFGCAALGRRAENSLNNALHDRKRTRGVSMQPLESGLANGTKYYLTDRAFLNFHLFGKAIN